MAFIDQRLGSRKSVSIGAVALVHVLIGYAFITGLAGEFVRTEVFGPTQTYNVPQEVPKPRPLPHATQKPTHRIDITDPLVKDPVADKPPIELTPANPPIDIRPFFPPATQPSTTSLSRGLQPAKGRDGWVTSDDYPPSSVRNEEEGAVRISVRVGTDGRVLSCEVTASSGHQALDDATCRYYAKRARFTPALSADGTPVESGYSDRVVWRLPEE